MPRLFGEARRRNIRTVFWLRNFAYKDLRFFGNVDATIAPSSFAATHYADYRIPVVKVVAPLILKSKTLVVGGGETKKYVTFVNPEPRKGLYVVARIIHLLGRERPDIPFLLVESRETADAIYGTGLDFSDPSNISFMQNTPDPCDFYKRTYITLMPSLWCESFGRVAAESMMNGIPVLASDRGALPEVCGEAGFLFHIPEKHTPETRTPISVEEARPWAETIIRLWDNQDEYRELSRKAKSRSERWHPDLVARQYDSVFTDLIR